jgi:UDP-3-O-[3-hydroxymyristoyl] glucosamine N-acyltransferase
VRFGYSTQNNESKNIQYIFFIQQKKRSKQKQQKNIGYIIIENNQTNTFPCDTFFD